MPRIYTSYSDEEFFLIKQRSESIGMSMSSYQKYCTLLTTSSPASNNQPVDIAPLIQTMTKNLSEKKPGDLFIVSSLLPNEWPTLSKRIKNTLSQNLKRIIANNPEKYAINAVLSGKINQYIALEGEVNQLPINSSEDTDALDYLYEEMLCNVPEEDQDEVWDAFDP